MIGIDLAVRRPSSLAGYLKGSRIWLWKADPPELLEGKLKAELIVIDAPLSLPKEGAFRDFEREMLSRGYKLLPLKKGPMRELAIIGYKLKRKLEDEGIKVLETHPASALKALGTTRHHVVSILSRIGFASNPPASRDDEDALICLLVGMLYLKGEVEVFEGRDGSIILPRPDLKLEELNLS